MNRIFFTLIFISASLLLPSKHLTASETSSEDTNNLDYTIGVCALIENQPLLSLSTKSTISPVLLAWNYLTKELKVSSKSITAEMYNNARIDIIKNPVYGKLDFDEAQQNATYIPNDKGFYGVDSSTFTLAIGHHKVKLIYSFNVLMQVEDETEEYNPYKDKNKCPKGRIWKM